MSEWRTIESAPSYDNKTEVLVFGGRHGPCRILLADGEYWREEASRQSRAVPTHWMPLPDPPTT